MFGDYVKMKELKVGDEIAYSKCGGFAWCPQFDKVAKITPSGIIQTEKGLRFNSGGNEIKSKANQYPNKSLDLVDRARKHLAEKEREVVTQKQLQAIQEVINGHERTMSQVRKDMLIKLVNDLTVTDDKD